MAGETPATAGPQLETFAPHSQSITFGLENHSAFLNTLLGLVSDGQVRVVQVATWRDDWKSIHEPRRYLLLSVVRREDMGVAGLVIEAAPGYAFLTPCTQAGVAFPDAVSIIVPTTRIARLHVRRGKEHWQISGPEHQFVDQLEPDGEGPVPVAPEPSVPRPRVPRSGRRLPPEGSLLAAIGRWIRAGRARRAGTSTWIGDSVMPDPEAMPTLAGWINSLPELPPDPLPEPAAASGGWVVPDDGEEDTGSGHSQVA